MTEANWQELSFYEVKAGDTLKVVSKYEDGTITTVEGVADHFDHFTHNAWVSTLNKPVLKRNYDSYVDSRSIFRKEKTQAEKDAEFVFPTGVGAVISVEAKPTGNGSAIGFVFNGKEWRATNVPCARARNEAEIRSIYEKFSTLSEGVNV